MNDIWSAIINLGACAYKGHIVNVRGLTWVDTREKCLRIRAFISGRFLGIQESFSAKRNARNLRVCKKIRRYTFVGQRYCINEDIIKELALSFKN
jgi:hypothetical protein